jgi:hypothetical protein
MTDETNFALTHPNEFEQGRRSCLASIHQEDAPYAADSDAHKAWQAGFDSAEGEAARNKTSGPVESADPAADAAAEDRGQFDTVSKY